MKKLKPILLAAAALGGLAVLHRGGDGLGRSGGGGSVFLGRTKRGGLRGAHKVGVELRLGVAAAACALCGGIALTAGAVVIVTAAVVASAGSALVIIHEWFLFCFDFGGLLLFCRRGLGRTLFFGRSGFGGFFRLGSFGLFGGRLFGLGLAAPHRRGCF